MDAIQPLVRLEAWLDEARASGEPTPEAMALATVGANGEPSVRTVSLKEVDRSGLVFTTNLKSRKAHDLDSAPRAALTFWWPRARRQVRAAGSTELLRRDATERLFTSRPLRHRLQTLVSPQGEPIESLEPLRAELERRHRDAPPACPDWFGAVRVVPSVVEFWEERPDRLHERCEYFRRDGGWTCRRLAP
jgi:pyridoxamine 5'-phosphate oxidase